MKSKVKHTTIRNDKFFCLNCGGEWQLQMPIPVKEFAEKGNAFNVLHQDCKPTWKQPVVSQDKDINEKMMFWLAQGERGISSETMFEKLSGKKLRDSYHCHPSDPDDFRRCYLLLETIPEWKSRLCELRDLSLVWDKLVTHWDRLTKMLEEQLKTHKTNGMYEFMKELGC